MQRLKTINIIAFDIPYPANYGGVIDIFHKVKALKENGVGVILHCFEYGRNQSKILNQYCQEVYYYPRKTYTNLFSASKPYIVASRSSTELLQNLLSNDAPILFEGLHTTFYLNHPSLKDRFKLLRMHNIEHLYYKHLEYIERNYFKKYFFRIESERLKKYQRIIKHAQCILAISEQDYGYFSRRHPNVVKCGPFHDNQKVRCKPKRKVEDVVLYHGNLAVGENDAAALYLCNYVFPNLPIDAIVAGNSPSGDLKKAIAQCSNVSLKANLTTEEIHDLVSRARVNVLYTNQATGIKLKLINVLYRGGHCVVNDKMIEGTQLEPLVKVGNTSTEIVQRILESLETPFDDSDFEKRKELLDRVYSNQRNAEILIEACSDASVRTKT
jgi:hypothetical protein